MMMVRLLEAKLVGEGYQVFIDRHLQIGMHWAKEIEQRIASADVVVPLIPGATLGEKIAIRWLTALAHENPSATNWMEAIAAQKRKQAYFEALDANVPVIQIQDGASRTKIIDAVFQ